jgi:hypothetical protein
MTTQDVPASPDLPAALLDLPAALLRLLAYSIPRDHSTFDWNVQHWDGATEFTLRYEDETKQQPKTKARARRTWRKKARVDPATRPTDTTDSRKKKKADSPPSSDTTATSGTSKPDAPARKTALFRATPLTLLKSRLAL